jgi:hypothetical protein
MGIFGFFMDSLFSTVIIIGAYELGKTIGK